VPNNSGDMDRDLEGLAGSGDLFLEEDFLDRLHFSDHHSFSADRFGGDGAVVGEAGGRI